MKKVTPLKQIRVTFSMEKKALFGIAMMLDDTFNDFRQFIFLF